jgi:hypothetical protein
MVLIYVGLAKTYCRTRISAGLAYDAMNEDRQGYENFNAKGEYGVKGTYAVMNEILYGI